MRTIFAEYNSHRNSIDVYTNAVYILRIDCWEAEKKEIEERLEKQRAEKQEQEERQYNLKIDGKDVDDLTGKMVELVGTSIPIGVTESGVSAFDALA